MFTPIFTGNLVRLTPPQPEDRLLFAQWSHDDEYMRLLDDDPVRPQTPATYDFFGAAIKPEDAYYFHLRTLADDQVIGFVALFQLKWRNQSATMAIGIGPTAYRGKGYGHDALKLILNYGFSELGLHRIELTVMAYNTQAIKAYERVGFIREGAQRQAIYRDGQRYDMLLYGILREEWLAIKQG